MSDNWLIIVPRDAWAVPPQERQTATMELLKRFAPDSDGFEIDTSELPELYHPYSNFEFVNCPFCGADVLPWWFEQMEDFDGHLPLVETPCCKRTTTLNDLVYDFPLGFARVGFSLMNPGFIPEPVHVEQIEAALGAPIRVIWRHL